MRTLFIATCLFCTSSAQAGWLTDHWLPEERHCQPGFELQKDDSLPFSICMRTKKTWEEIKRDPGVEAVAKELKRQECAAEPMDPHTRALCERDGYIPRPSPSSTAVHHEPAPTETVAPVLAPSVTPVTVTDDPNTTVVKTAPIQPAPNVAKKVIKKKTGAPADPDRVRGLY
jgi:hypothetical protein